MREIKFRAWDLHEKRMIQSYAHKGINNRLYIASQADDAERIELMQFTGLKDKNGKEIYEGDIIRTDAFYSKTLKNYLVRWDKWAAWYDLRCTEDQEDVEFLGTGVQNVTLYSSSEYSREIIGNIHENPELSGGINAKI